MRLPFIIALATAVILLGPGQARAADEKAPEEKVAKKSWAYPTPELQKMFAEAVYLEKGDGPFADAYKPIPLYMYMNPLRHYVRPDIKMFPELMKKFQPDQCVECHADITPGIVNSWKASTHAQPKRNEYFAAKTAEIEKRLGREIKEVDCSGCHGKSHDVLQMPTVDNACGECHLKQAEEYASERKYGRPSHLQSWEANVVVPWYIESYRQGEGASLIGCDMCHEEMARCDTCHTRHSFSAAEGRRPEACMSCHMGPDHPDWETYSHSKMGTIYELEGEHWPWDKPLGDIIPGKDYKSPTCQYCHMYMGGNKWTINPISKGIWRMGTVPPKEVEYKSSLKDYPYGINIPPLDAKLEVYSPENLQKRELWIEMCGRCHSSRFARLWLENMDQYMFLCFKKQDEAQLILDQVVAEGLLNPAPKDRPVFPMGDVLADALGPDKLGMGVYKAFKDLEGRVPVIGPILGVYSVFITRPGTPSAIEREYAEMWFWYKLKGYKGTAHAQQDYSWWYGWSHMIGSLARIQDEANRLRRLKALEEK
ncbi:MAG: hydroxylamine oxidoreductase [Candidatus Brocadiales bacterium]|nr:hydroxylamine oxidoreductase [Candidatus Bathyanammoxibius amoris]